MGKQMTGAGTPEFSLVWDIRVI